MVFGFKTIRQKEHFNAHDKMLPLFYFFTTSLLL